MTYFKKLVSELLDGDVGIVKRRVKKFNPTEVLLFVSELARQLDNNYREAIKRVTGLINS